MAQRLDGRMVAEEIRAELRRRVSASAPDRPGLLLLRVGEDPASQIYVKGKDKAAAEVGIDSRVEVLPESTPEADLLARVAGANRDPRVHGLLVQLPLPPTIRPEAVAEAIDPEKDVDGLHPWNQGRLALGRPAIVPCTPLGILTLLHRYRIVVAGARVVVLGRSAIVGRPVSLLLGLKAPWADATVTSAHSRSRELAAVTREADIVVAAIGRPRFVTGEMVRPGAAVVDVGIHRLPASGSSGEGKLVGDVDAASVDPVAAWLSPVPGGVGPLTVAMLLANTVDVWERRAGRASVPAWMTVAGISPGGPGANGSG
jgi:methylenetetrahydrofolate dehydrogenase (NADP+)/methenyltetrahydrofolate cyclohydrolase